MKRDYWKDISVRGWNIKDWERGWEEDRSRRQIESSVFITGINFRNIDKGTKYLFTWPFNAFECNRCQNSSTERSEKPNETDVEDMVMAVHCHGKIRQKNCQQNHHRENSKTEKI